MATKVKKPKKTTKKASISEKQLNVAFHICEAGFAFALIEHSPACPAGEIVAVMKTDAKFIEGTQGDLTYEQKKALYDTGIKSQTFIDAGNADTEAKAEGKSYTSALLTREEHVAWEKENAEKELDSYRQHCDTPAAFGGGDDDDNDFGSQDDDGDGYGKGDSDFDDGEGFAEEPEDSMFRIVEEDVPLLGDNEQVELDEATRKH